MTPRATPSSGHSGAPDSALILIVDDDSSLRAAVATALRTIAREFVEAGSAAEALELASAQRVDLIVLDLGLPDGGGAELCRELRRVTTVPIVVLTARHAEMEKVDLFNAGADDYVTKPFGAMELGARVAVQLRRMRERPTAPHNVLIAGSLRIDFDHRVITRQITFPVHKSEAPLPRARLTPTEWEILRALSRERGKVYTHQQIFDMVWSRDYGDARQYLRVHVTNLRRKIEENPANPNIIVTEPGVGYRLNV